MLAALTGLGLSTAAGLNAYIPLLVVGVLANLTDAVRLPHDYAWLGDGWVLAIIGVLLAAELVLDKVPVVDHVNDMIQTAVRPAAGGVVFTATQAAERFDHSAWMSGHPWVSWVLGIGIALAVHVMKATARPVVNVSTAGAGAPVVSTVEDAGALGMSLVAVFFPVLVVVALVVLAVPTWWALRRVRRLRARRAARRTSPDPPGRLREVTQRGKMAMDGESTSQGPASTAAG
ncbi:membrane protein [Sphaerisporangium melleum]|uniref:Membrane protein n=2 Tax=Sphaerisporangium melleum TaxID=321316 RepID=A0A917RJV6_9ACTN|nr:membrane protein [Sphaerisporangium melleum]GII70736.1 membrane protein [Sphaerisporangium melleum]